MPHVHEGSVSAGYQVEVGAGAGRGAGGSRRQECGRWIEDPRPGVARRITSLWIGHQNESPPRGRSAIEWLLERARGTLLLNIREKFENGKPRGTDLLNNFASSGEFVGESRESVAVPPCTRRGLRPCDPLRTKTKNLSKKKEQEAFSPSISESSAYRVRSTRNRASVSR